MIKNPKLTTLVIACLFISTANLYAGASNYLPVYQGDSKVFRTDNRGYAGLAWKLDGSVIPDLSFGFRSLRVDSNDNVQGADLNARISLKDKTFDSVRLSYVGGSRDVAGNIGVGYSVTQSSLLATVAIEGAYVKLGSDFLLSSNSFSPYIETNSLSKPNKVLGKQNYVCPSGSLTSVTINEFGGYVVNGTDGVNGDYVINSANGLVTCF